MLRISRTFWGAVTHALISSKLLILPVLLLTVAETFAQGNLLIGVGDNMPPQDVPDLARTSGSTRDLLDSILGEAKKCRNVR